MVFEVNIDALVGLTHHFGGLAHDDQASRQHGGHVANPQAAALQGLEKMRLLHEWGIKQCVFPPPMRPISKALSALGFDGDLAKQLKSCYQHSKYLFSALNSASHMWIANSATVTPSIDSQDNRVHFTPANLIGHYHRFCEVPHTQSLLQQVFADQRYFAHHSPLPSQAFWGDEGAANHTRLCKGHSQPGLNLFVYGREGFQPNTQELFARQSRHASAAIARCHQQKHSVLVAQNPQVIQRGVFHNDVIATGNENVWLYHEKAFVNNHHMQAIREFLNDDFYPIVIKESQLSVHQSVSSYLFNSQCLTMPDGTMTLLAPSECQQHYEVTQVIKAIMAADSPISHFEAIDCSQSMHNGGGPACLRLRVVLAEEQWQAVHPGVKFTEKLYQQLVDIVKRYYPTELLLANLQDPSYYHKNQEVMTALAEIMSLSLD